MGARFIVLSINGHIVHIFKSQSDSYLSSLIAFIDSVCFFFFLVQFKYPL